MRALPGEGEKKAGGCESGPVQIAHRDGSNASCGKACPFIGDSSQIVPALSITQPSRSPSSLSLYLLAKLSHFPEKWRAAVDRAATYAGVAESLPPLPSPRNRRAGTGGWGALCALALALGAGTLSTECSGGWRRDSPRR